MSDTVLIALITFGSGFVGALFGFLTARMSAKEQRKREAESLLFQTRLKTYSEYLEALKQWADDPLNPKGKRHFFRKTSEASLLASDQTDKFLDRVQMYVHKFNGEINENAHNEFLMNKSLMLDSMRKDLLLVRELRKARDRSS